MFLYKYTIALVFILGVITSKAQFTSDTSVCNSSCCCKNDLTPAGTMISHVHEKNEWMISYRYMSMGMNGIVSDNQSRNKNDVLVNYLMSPDNMRMDMHMLMAMYGVTNRLTVMAMFNYNVSTMSMSMLETAPMANMPGMSMGNMNMSQTMKTSGLGDIKLYALYSIIKQQNHQLLVSTGLNIPTGNIELKGKSNDMMYANKRLPYAMQMGSGTYDVLPCINYLYQKQKIAFSAQVSAVVRTGYNSVGYQLGNEASINTWFAYQWLGFLSSSVRIEGNVAEKISGYDPTLYYYNEPSANPYNYGGKKINCYIGSQFHFKTGVLKNTRLGAEYGIPLYQDLNGTQMKLKQNLYASLSVAF